MSDDATSVQRVQNELFAIQQAYAASQVSVADLTHKLSESQREIARLQPQVVEASQVPVYKLKVEQLEGTVLAYENENNRLKSARSILDDELRALRSDCSNKAKEIASLQGTVALQKSKIDDQSTNILRLNKQIVELEEDVAAAENEAQAARVALREAESGQRVSSTQHENAETRDELEAVLDEKEKLLQRISAITAERDELQQQCSQLTAQEASQRVEPKLIPAAGGSPMESNATDASARGFGGSPKSTAIAEEDIYSMSTAELRSALQNCIKLQEEHKRARSSLLHAMQAESLESERLRHEVDALGSSLKEADNVSNAWQAQAQGALAQIDRLKDMLSEGASWMSEEDLKLDNSATVADEASAPQQQSGRAHAQEHVDGGSAHAMGSAGEHAPPRDAQCPQCTRQHQLVLKHAAEAASLELQLRAMCAERMRTSHVAGQIGRATLPALYSIEQRLLEMTS